MSHIQAAVGNHLLALPVELLEELVAYLDVNSICNLAMTCQYFSDLVEGCTKVWKCIDIREGPFPTEKIELCVGKINELTTHICFRGSCYETIPKNLLNVVSPLKNLKVVALENQTIDGNRVSLKEFPEFLEELSIKNTLVKHAQSFFKGFGKSMQNLKVLIIDGCRWMNLRYLKSLSQCKNLEILSAVNCLNHIFHIAYVWENRPKWDKLKILDFRFTVARFGYDLAEYFDYSSRDMGPIQILYFQNVTAAPLDYGKQITYQLSQFKYVDVEDDITDQYFCMYMSQLGVIQDLTHQLPNSYLYKDPYSDCTCNYKEKGEASGLIIPDAVEYVSDFMLTELEDIDPDKYSSSSEDSDSDWYSYNMNWKRGYNKKALRRLSLRGFKDITDISLCKLNVDLELLDLTYTGVTKEGIEYYLNRYPNCRIIHPLYCTCKPRSPF